MAMAMDMDVDMWSRLEVVQFGFNQMDENESLMPPFLTVCTGVFVLSVFARDYIMYAFT